VVSSYVSKFYLFIYLYFFVVLGFELRAYTLSQPTTPFFVIEDLTNYLLGLALNSNPSDLCLLSS
jgi:hypothetical protein